MNTEWLMILAVGGGSSLFAIGGTGFKWHRRYLLPLLLATILILGGFPVWKAVCYGLAMIVALSMGYGERCPYWRKGLIFCLYSAPSLLFGISIWQVITPVVLILMFWGSNTRFFEKQIPWKVWELTAGALIGITIAVFL